jgi:hypothetical protein
MSTINILIKGLALCFRQDNDWKVYFLCDEKHKLKFTHYRNGVVTGLPDIELCKAGREIFFEASDTQDVEDYRGSFYGNIFNINHDYAHDGAINLIPDSRIPAGRELVKMTIQDAELNMANPTPDQLPTEEKYHIMIKDQPDTEREIHVVARTIVAKIALNSGNFNIRGRDHEFPPDLPGSAYEVGTEYHLVFDNDCGNDCGDDDDFEEYYDLLEDPRGLRFIAGRPPLLKSVDVVPDGNCDPIVSDPPPGS